MTPVTASLLMTVHRTTTELGRAPYTSDIARALGANPRAVGGRLRRAGLAGHLTFAAVPGARHPASVRITPGAKVELGLPVVVLLAMPEPDGYPDQDVAAMLCGLRIAAVGAHLTPDWPLRLAAAAQVAPACDGVVVFRDRMLLGRADVHAARVARVRCAFVETWEILSKVTARTIWAHPFLEPDLPSAHTRAVTG